MLEILSEIAVAFLSTLLSSFTGISESIIEAFFRKKNILENEKKQQEILSRKIEELTKSLHESSRLMSEIEAEFERQKQLAKKWQEEAATSQIIASMNQEEVDAVTKLFGNQLAKESQKSGRQSWWWSLFFCLLGIAGGYIAGRFLP